MTKKNYVCVCCDPDWFCETKKALIAHYSKLHRDCPEPIFDAIGETWDAKLTELLIARHTAENERRDIQTKYEALGAIHIALMQKWNAILLIMVSKNQ